MFDYLQQFNNLPKELRDKVSSPAVMATLSELEKKYQVDLAMTVMKVMIKSLSVSGLTSYFISDFNLGQTAAENLSKELMEKVLLNVADYLDLQKQAKALDLDTDINLILEEAGLILPSSDLVSRFKSVLSTYLKGIRSKLAARDAFAKPINMGGLNLSTAEIDRVFKICEQKTFKSLEVNLAAVSKLISPQSRLDKIIASADGNGQSSEYNLKQAIASGQVKKPEFKLDTKHELSVPKQELSLPWVEAPTKVVIPTQAVTPAHAVAQAAVKAAVQVMAPVIPIPKPPVRSANPVPPITLVKPATPVMAPSVGTPAKTVFPPNAKMFVPPITKPNIPSVQKPIASARPAFSSSISKQAMHDIKPMPKVMGPLEELQFLDLINFRRLGKTPAEITAKIFSKIKLLEADGYDKMVAGVHAWRQSPVNHLYLKMVQEAISKGMTIKDLALAKQKDIVESKRYLNLEEIEAILSMNSKLVF